MLVVVGLVGLLSAPVRAEVYTLETLLNIARKTNPGVAATRQATEAVGAQLSEAWRSWWPTGELTTAVAPAPEIECQAPPGLPVPQGLTDREFALRYCAGTNRREAANLAFAGWFTRTQINLIQPIYTFGKISAGIAAAEAGVEASENRTKATIAAVEFNVKRAYWGLKLARAILATLQEGMGYVDEAEKRIQKSLDEGNGDVSVTDKLRVETVRAELQSRVLETKRGLRIAQEALRALIGAAAPREIDIDPEELAPVEAPERPADLYQDRALVARPEVRALDNLVLSKRKLAELEWRKQLPDLILVGSVTYAYASSIDDPQNAFLNDPFNRFVGGLAAALRLPLDLGVRNARANRMFYEAEETAYRRLEAMSGIRFEVAQAHAAVTETRERIEVLAKGEKVARRWMTSMLQKMELGLAETKEITDALQGYFNLRLRHLQAMHDFNLAVADLTRATGAPVAE